MLRAVLLKQGVTFRDGLVFYNLNFIDPARGRRRNVYLISFYISRKAQVRFV